MTESELLAFADVARRGGASRATSGSSSTRSSSSATRSCARSWCPAPTSSPSRPPRSRPSGRSKEAIEAGFSRIPVYDASMDDIVGIAFTKDLVLAVRARQASTARGRGVPPGAHYVPETKRVAPLLREMQAGQLPPRRRGRRVRRHRRHRHPGGPDRGARRRDLRRVRRRRAARSSRSADGQFRVSGKMAVDEVNDFLGAELPVGTTGTPSAASCSPSAGTSRARASPSRSTATSSSPSNVQGRRIGTVRVTRRAAPAARRTVGIRTRNGSPSAPTGTASGDASAPAGLSARRPTASRRQPAASAADGGEPW